MPPLPPTAKGAATHRRILDAAAVEFAASGIAGSRIDRITLAAGTNKAQVYGYFGSKDELFDAVLADLVDQITSAVEFDARDLAGWAVRLYDYYLARPDLDRLTTWFRLERRPVGKLFVAADDAAKVAAIIDAQRDGVVRAGEPRDILAIVIALSRTWGPSSASFTAGDEDAAAEHSRRKWMLRESVERAVAS